MKAILTITVLALVVAAFVPRENGPTPEQQAIAALQGQVDELRNQVADSALSKKWDDDIAETRKLAESMKQPKPLPFKDAYPEAQQTLEGLNTAVNKCVDACTHATIELESLRADVAKLSEAAKTCEAPAAKADKPKTTITLPTSEYNTAVAAAQATGREVLFVLRQDGCYFCDELEQNVTHQPYFQDEISRRYVLSEINISRDLDSARHFTVRRTPAVLVYNPTTMQWRTMQNVPRNIPAFLALLKGM